MFHAMNAQVNQTGGKHALNIELVGRAFLFGSFNYEYALTNQISLGGGLGLGNIQAGDITRDNNGIPENGRYFDMSSTQMIYGNYFIGKHKHKLYFTAGATNFLIVNRNKYPSETEFFVEPKLEWNLGLGYQFSGARTYYRLTAYCISLPDDSSFFPKYLPWLGLSMGYKL